MSLNATGLLLLKSCTFLSWGGANLNVYLYVYVVSFQVISKSTEQVVDSTTEEKYLIATSEQPLCAMHR